MEKNEEKIEKHLTDFYREICEPINKLQGNKLAVSKFVETGAGDTFTGGYSDHFPSLVVLQKEFTPAQYAVNK